MIWEQIQRLISGVGLPSKRPFHKVLEHKDFANADVTLGANTVFTKIGEYVVPAQQQIAIGYGVPNTNETGRLFVDLEDTAGNDIDGWVRIAVANANETAIDVVLEQRTEILSENPTDMTKWVSLPEIKEYPVLGRIPREDDRIQIYVKPDVSGKIVDFGETVIHLPVSVYM
ncbi:MAG: hypothetical protein QXG39_04850 [Candidatus Aenigmatarchaeota archaeon]